MKGILVIGLTFVALLLAVHGWAFRDYPYGVTHCCDKALNLYLTAWADGHGGKYPDAGSSAASLALLIQDEKRIDFMVPIIAGKAIDPKKAIAYYHEHHTLSEDLCSWHYVPGLTTNSPPGQALVWDTTGLSHNGKRTNPPCHEYVAVDGTAGSIPEKDWPAFLQRQRDYAEGRIPGD